MPSEIDFQVKTLLLRAGVDAPVLYGILSKVTLAAFSLLTILIITWRVRPEVQGYYYTFLNLTALQVFAELGLGTVIVQVTSHLWAFLRLDEQGRVTGEADALSRLSTLARKVLRWYGVAGSGTMVVLGVAGFLFFSHSRADGTPWRAPWAVLCALVGARMWLAPVWSLLEGSNQVASLYRYRFLAALIGGVSTAGALVMGLDLWTPAIGVGSELAFSVLYAIACHRQFVGSLLEARPGPALHWRREILPLQLRIAGSWISGYFITMFFTPVLFHFQGPREAGQWGMTWSMFAMVTSISGLWIYSRGPQFGIWIARREFETLDREFLRWTKISTVLAVVGALMVWIGLWQIPRILPGVGDRVLGILPAGLLAVATILMSVPAAWSVYLRAHMKEPLTALSLVHAGLTAALTVLLGARYGAAGAAAGYLGVIAMVVVPCSGLIWAKCRSAWHAPAGEALKG